MQAEEHSKTRAEVDPVSPTVPALSLFARAVRDRLGWSGWLLIAGLVALAVCWLLLVARHAINPGSPVTPWYSPQGLAAPIAHNNSFFDLVSRQSDALKLESEGGVPAGSVSFAYSPQGDVLAVGGNSGQTELFGREGALAVLADAHKGSVTALSFYNNGERLASAGEDGQIILRQIGPTNSQPNFVGAGGQVQAVAVVDETSGSEFPEVLVGHADGRVQSVRFGGKEVIDVAQHKSNVTAVAYAPQASIAVSAGQDELLIFTPFPPAPQSGQSTPQQAIADNAQVSSRNIVLFDAGSRLLSGSRDGTLKQWNLNGELVGSAKVSEQPVTWVAVSSDDARAAVGTEDGQLIVWEIESGIRIASFQAAGPVRFTAFSSNGQIISVDQAGRLRRFSGAAQMLAPPPLFVIVLAVASLLFIALLRALGHARDELIAETKFVPTSAASAFLDSEGPLDDPANAGRAIGELSERLSRFIRNKNTSTPVTFAVAGAWGTGKSSVMRIVQAKLRSFDFPTVWFNAWHHQNEEQLFAALMEAVRSEAVPPFLSFASFKPRQLAFRGRLLYGRIIGSPFKYVIRITIAFAVLVLMWSLWSELQARQDVYKALLEKHGVDFLLAAPTKIAGLVGGVVAIWLSIKGLVMPFLSQPAALLQRADGILGPRRFTDRLSFRQSFASAYSEVCNAFGNRRLTIFIDDIDRCRPERVVEMMEAINFLTTNGNCFVVMGVSEEPVQAAIGISFEKVAAEVAAARLPRPPKVPPDAFKQRQDFAQAYLEKLITLRVPVPAFDGEALQNLLQRGAVSRTARMPSMLMIRDAAIFLLALLGGGYLAAQLAGFVKPYFLHLMLTPPKQTDDSEKPGGGGETTTPPPDTGTGGGTSPETTPAVGGTDAAGTDAQVVAAADSAVWQYVLWGLAAVGLAASLAAFVSPDLRRYLAGKIGRDGGVLGDSDAYRSAFELWVPLVLDVRKSPRAIKRFANRMRYLTSDMDASNATLIANTVACGALVECEPQFRSDDWRNKNTATGLPLNSDMTECLLQLKPDDWTAYLQREAGAILAPQQGLARAS